MSTIEPKKDLCEEMTKTMLSDHHGDLMMLLLESKMDGSVIEVNGRNHYLDKVPHFVGDDGTIYPYARFSVREFL